MQHPLHKLGKKNRNIISGLLVCAACVYAVARFANVPQSQLNTFFITTALFVFSVILLSIATLILVKGLLKLKNHLFNDNQESESSSSE